MSTTNTVETSFRADESVYSIARIASSDSSASTMDTLQNSNRLVAPFSVSSNPPIAVKVPQRSQSQAEQDRVAQSHARNDINKQSFNRYACAVNLYNDQEDSGSKSESESSEAPDFGSDDSFPSALLCSSSISNDKTGKRSEEKLKEDILNYPLIKLPMCNSSTCKISGGRCVHEARFGDIVNLRSFLWGKPDEKPFSTTERRQRWAAEIQKAYCKNKNSYHWKVFETEVCEVGFLILAGISTKSNISDAPNMWRNLRKKAPDGNEKFSFNNRVNSKSKKRKMTGG